MSIIIILQLFSNCSVTASTDSKTHFQKVINYYKNLDQQDKEKFSKALKKANTQGREEISEAIEHLKQSGQVMYYIDMRLTHCIGEPFANIVRYRCIASDKLKTTCNKLMNMVLLMWTKTLQMPTKDKIKME